MRWTHRSLIKLQGALKRRGFKASPPTIARLMHERDFSLRTCRKNKAGTRHKDRDRQFRYLVRMRKLYRARGWPVISVDTKKKEWVGDFKNPGRKWRREDREVLPDAPDEDQQERSQGKQPGPATPERLALFYAADLAAGRVPSKRQIKREWPVGFDAASELHEHLAARAAP